MSIYTQKQSKIIALILIVILGLFLIYSLSILFSAILAAVILYVLFKPMFVFLTLKKKLNRSLSAVLIIIVSLIIITIPFLGLTWMLADKILYYKDHPEIINEIIISVQNFIGKTFDQGTVNDTLKRAGTWSVGIISGFVNSALDILLTISMMYFFLYFMLKNHMLFEDTLIKYMPFRSRNSEHFAKELKNITYSNVIGQGIISLAQAVCLGIGFIIFGIPDFLFWSVVCFFLSFLPVVGSAGVFVPAGIIELASGDTFSGFGIIIYGFVVVSNIDNLLRLWINKWLGNIHPLITITGIVIGLPIFGILGLVFGPFLISLFLLLIRLYEAAYVNETAEKERIVNQEEL